MDKSIRRFGASISESRHGVMPQTNIDGEKWFLFGERLCYDGIAGPAGQAASTVEQGSVKFFV
jgi:hypothetical protein